MNWGELFSKDVIESLSWFGLPEQSQESDPASAYLEWLDRHHSHILTAPMGQRHIRLWEWFEALAPAVKPDPRVEVWPRGGAKSSTAEMAVAYVGSKLSRRYCLYVSETQDQADKHVAAIAAILERSGIERSLNKYGQSRGWRRNQLRASNGFNVEALGLDTAARGIKLDEFRPDLIVFDDIDNQKDSAKTTQKKETAIKTSIVPAGSVDCAVLFIQNMIMEDGIVAKLYDGRADFLLRRDVPPFEPAVRGLSVESVEDEDRPGRMMFRISQGEPTWEGQDLATCEAQINEWGLAAFLRESQHEVAGADGIFFNISMIRESDPSTWPKMVALARAWDFAATEGGGDWTVGGLVGKDEHDVFYGLDMERGQWGTDTVWTNVIQAARDDREQWGEVVQVIPKDTGAAGKSFAIKLRRALMEDGHRCVIVPVQGNKALRAKPFQKELNAGNFILPSDADWGKAFKDEVRRFKEDMSHLHDDIVDSFADAFKVVARPPMKIY